MNDKTKVNIRIFDQDYTIVGTEKEEYIQKIALYVDKKMREMARATNNSLKPHMLAVLSAVNICDEYYKLKEKSEHLDGVEKKATEETEALSNKNKLLKKENDYLKEEIQNLKIELARRESRREGR